VVIVAFKHMVHDNDLIDTFISLWTKSKYIHAQIIFPNGMVGSSWMEMGVALRPLEDVIIYPFYFDYVIIEDKQMDEEKAYRFIQSEYGKKFDMRGAMLSTTFPYTVHNRNKRHCSELSFSALRKGGILKKYEDVPAESVSPQRLFTMLKDEGKYTVVTN